MTTRLLTRGQLVLVTALLALGVARPASAETAADALKRGVELYKAGNYAEAVSALETSYRLEPKPDTLFTLAQAQRLAGDCERAVENYRKVIAQVGDLNVAKLVQHNLSLCGGADAKPPEPRRPEPAPGDETSAEPQIVEKTVVREVQRADPVFASLLAGGALTVGAGAGLFVAASGSRDAADRAGSLADHGALADRARVQQAVAWIATSAGVAMLGVAAYRWLSRRESPTTDVAVAPSPDGALVIVRSRW
jgi:tetratricopeptide (TPR) repeat protein